MKFALLLLPLAAAASLAPAQAPWTPAQSQEILDKTLPIRLAPDLSHLTAGERAAVAKLVEVGGIFQELYEEQRHHQALAAKARLRAGTPEATLYRLFNGPTATTLDNRVVPFLPVAKPPPGKNVYPLDLTQAEFEAFLAANPQRRAELGHVRSVIRRADRASLASDLATLQRYPALDILHHGLRERLQRMARAPDRKQLYGLPFSVAYAPQLVRASALLQEAADAVEGDDEQFARYLRNRSRDLLSDDYESGDAAWLKGKFKHLNAQIGAYESYDDELAGTRAFHSLSLLATRTAESAALRKAMQGMQELEDSLPYARHRKIQEDIPVGVYDVIADFGQARGTNTATNLPNEAYLAERYGSIILLRTNIMRNPDLFRGAGDTFGAAIVPDQARDLTADANFYRTLWHEVGHYLGPDVTASGESLDALGADSNLLEEIKADLVSLFVARELARRNYYTAGQLRALYASGILRVLQNNKPRREQPYNMMQLMQWNWFLDRGVLSFDPATAKMRIDYGKYHAAVGDLLKEIIAFQESGDAKRAAAFIDRWGAWDENLHGRIAASIRNQQRYRYRLVRYSALGE